MNIFKNIDTWLKEKFGQWLDGKIAEFYEDLKQLWEEYVYKENKTFYDWVLWTARLLVVGFILAALLSVAFVFAKLILFVAAVVLVLTFLQSGTADLQSIIDPFLEMLKSIF